MESALLDHVIPRRGELGLTGAPETWHLHDLLLQAMGVGAQPKDRALAFHLFASRNLLYPANQMVTPVIITETSFEGLYAFVLRALHQLGFGAPVDARPSGFLRNEDMLQ